jgi:hypothetical protein
LDYAASVRRAPRWIGCGIALLGLWSAAAGAGCARLFSSSHPLRPGDPIPDLEARNQNGAPVRLAQYRGHPLVVYFYPKDGTSG